MQTLDNLFELIYNMGANACRWVIDECPRCMCDKSNREECFAREAPSWSQPISIVSRGSIKFNEWDKKITPTIRNLESCPLIFSLS